MVTKDQGSSEGCFDVRVGWIPWIHSVWRCRWSVSGQRAAVCYANTHPYTQSRPKQAVTLSGKQQNPDLCRCSQDHRDRTAGSGILECERAITWDSVPIWLSSLLHAFRLFRLGLFKAAVWRSMYGVWLTSFSQLTALEYSLWLFPLVLIMRWTLTNKRRGGGLFRELVPAL